MVQVQKRAVRPSRAPSLSGAPAGPRRPELRRQALIDAAISLIVRHETDGFTIEDIVAAAQMSKGSFYHYFTSKEALLATLRSHFSDQLVTKVRTAVDACAADDWSAKMAGWIGAVIAGHYEMAVLHTVLFHGKNENTTVSITASQSVRYLIALLANGDKAGAWTAKNPALMAVAIFSCLHGLFDEAMLGTLERKEIEQAAPMLVSDMLRTRVKDIALPQTHPEYSPLERYAELKNAGLTAGDLHQRLVQAHEFHEQFLRNAQSSETGVRVTRMPEGIEKFIRRSGGVPHAVVEKLGSNSFAKRRPDEKEPFLRYIEQCYEAQRPLQLRLVVGPVKNVQRYGDYQLPDMAEYFALIQLARVVETIAAIYPYGVAVQMVPDDKRGGIANGWPASYSKIYISGLQRMVQDLGFSAWLKVEEGQARLYDLYHVEAHIEAAKATVLADPDFENNVELGCHHAEDNLLRQVKGKAEEYAARDSAIRYLILHKAEMLSGMWSPIDAFPLIYAHHEGNYQLYTMGRGLTKLPWQIRLSFEVLNAQERQLVALPQLQLANAA